MSQFGIKIQRKDIERNDFSLRMNAKDQFVSKQDIQTKFKTEFCRNLEAGFCEYGDKCFFAHSLEELRDKNHLSVIKQVKCKNFFELGYCLNGSRCQYSHREISPETAESSPNPSNKASRKGSEDVHKAPIFVDLESRDLF